MLDMLSLIPETDLIVISLGLLICFFMAFYAYFGGILNFYGSIGAFLMGFLIILFTDVFWFILLILFLFLTYHVTIWKYDVKLKKGYNEGKKGERGVYNVLSNGIIATIIAVLYIPLDNFSNGLPNFLFLISVGAAASDSFASEIGILSDKVYLITKPTLKVKPGIDGGISALGEVASFIGSLVIISFGYLLLTDIILNMKRHTLQSGFFIFSLGILLAWIGSQIDSVFGATLQRKGYLGNNGVNVVSNLTTTLTALLIYITLF